MQVSRHEDKQLVFLLGLARSGTKLLRALLNTHEDISILPIETQFIPKLHARFGNENLQVRSIFHDFHVAFQQSVYAINAGDAGVPLLDEEEWYQACPDFSFASIVRFFLFWSCTRIKPGATIVGDKTPSYTRHAELLANLFPDALFIHIVRDPRDRALSEFRVWGQSMVKSARDWGVSLQQLNQAIERSPKRFFECRYESLLSDTNATLAEAMAFLGLRFNKDNAQLSSSTELYGNAKNSRKVVNDNYGQYGNDIRPGKVRRMEEVAYPWMNHYGYEVNFATSCKPMSTTVNRLLYMHNRLRKLRFYCREKGAWNGFRYFREIRG